jgi:hypothetical protein
MRVAASLACRTVIQIFMVDFGKAFVLATILENEWLHGLLRSAGGNVESVPVIVCCCCLLYSLVQ